MGCHATHQYGFQDLLKVADGQTDFAALLCFNLKAGLVFRHGESVLLFDPAIHDFLNF